MRKLVNTQPIDLLFIRQPRNTWFAEVRNDKRSLDFYMICHYSSFLSIMNIP